MIVLLAFVNLFLLVASGMLLLSFSRFDPSERIESIKSHTLRSYVSVLSFGPLIINAFLLNWIALSTLAETQTGWWITALVLLTLLCLVAALGMSIHDREWFKRLWPHFPEKRDLEVNRKVNSSYWLSEEEASKIRREVDAYFRHEKLYLQQGFCVADLAESIDVSRHQLAACFTQAYNANFNELINRRRIEYGLQRVPPEEWERYTLEGMAYKLGFGSRSTFTKAFKKVTGVTPSKYWHGRAPASY